MKGRKQIEASTAHVYNKRLSEIWNSQLIQSIRTNHANLSSIAEYEENDSLNEHSKLDT